MMTKPKSTLVHVILVIMIGLIKVFKLHSTSSVIHDTLILADQLLCHSTLDHSLACQV